MYKFTAEQQTSTFKFQTYCLVNMNVVCNPMSLLQGSETNRKGLKVATLKKFSTNVSINY